jgi:hypothetical protein
MQLPHNKYDAIERFICNEGLKITSVDLSPAHDKLLIHLNTQLTIVTPTKNYCGLKDASEQCLKNYQIVDGADGIHWPDLDEDLTLKGLLKVYLRQRLKEKGELYID